MPEETTYTVKDEDKGMLILSYLGMLSIIPFFTVKKDNEYVRWHAKQGFVLFIAEIILMVLLIIMSIILSFIPGGYIFARLLWFFISLALIVLCIWCIFQAIQGFKWKIPFISDFAEKL